MTPTPEAPELDWQMRNNGQEYGPYSRQRILDMLAKRELPDTAMIRRCDMPDWLPVPEARQHLLRAQVPAAHDEAIDGEESEMNAMAHATQEAVPGDEKPAWAKKKPIRFYGMWIYTLAILLVLVGAYFFFRGDEFSGKSGYDHAKQELVGRMDYWRDHQVRLKSVAAEDVPGSLVSYSIEPLREPVGSDTTQHTFVVHCVFKDGKGAQTESKVTVTMGGQRVRLLNLFSK